MHLITQLRLPSIYFSTLLFTALITGCGHGGGPKVEEIELFPVRSGEEFQYVDASGKIVINPQFSYATVFRNGVALVCTSGDEHRWGFIDKTGSYVINANYKVATVFNEGIAWVVAENSVPVAIGPDGEERFRLQMAEKVRAFRDGLAAYCTKSEDGERWGFVDTKGEVIINPQFESVRDYVGGMAAVRSEDNKWGYIDKLGAFVINPQFADAADLVDGMAVVSNGKDKGVIDGEGHFVINPQFDEIMPDAGQFLVRQDKQWGWCDSEGNFVINPQFRSALPFNGSDLAAVESGGKWGYVDRSGKIMVNPQFDAALPFNSGHAIVVSAGKAGLIDESGKYLVNPQFDDVSDDIVHALVSGDSRFLEVESDYFDMTPLLDAITPDAPGGIEPGMNFDQVFAKFGQSGSSLTKVEDTHILEARSFDGVGDCKLIAHGKPFSPVEYGWSFRYAYNGGIQPEAFTYAIVLTGKGIGKAEQVAKAVQEKLKGYSKNEASGAWDGTHWSVFLDPEGSQLEVKFIPMQALTNTSVGQL